MWDLATYKLVCLITDAGKNEVTQAKVFHVSAQQDSEVHLISIDEEGVVTRTKIAKTLFGPLKAEKPARLQITARL